MKIILLSQPQPPYPVVISALRGEPKPGYGLKSSTLPAAGRNGGPAGMIVSNSYSENLIRCTLFLLFLLQSLEVQSFANEFWFLDHMKGSIPVICYHNDVNI